MTHQFEVGQKIRRTGIDTDLLEQGEEYTVGQQVGTSVYLKEYGGCYEAMNFRPVSDVRPWEGFTLGDTLLTTTTESDTMTHDNTELQTENLLRLKIGNLEDDLRASEEEVTKMNDWWYQEKTKADKLTDLVVKLTAKLMEA